MESGLGELRLTNLKNRFKWRGRRYLGGLMHGLALGLMLASLLVWRGVEGPALCVFGLVLAFLSVVLGNAVVGRPPKRSA